MRRHNSIIHSLAAAFNGADQFIMRLTDSIREAPVLSATIAPE